MQQSRNYLYYINPSVKDEATINLIYKVVSFIKAIWRDYRCSNKRQLQWHIIKRPACDTVWLRKTAKAVTVQAT